MKTAVIYTRVSTEDQAKKDLSIPYQLDRCKEMAKENDCVVVGEFSDPGKSGTNTNRPDLQKMFTFMIEKKVNALVVYKQDRLSRNMKDFWTMYEILKDNNIQFLSVTERFFEGSQKVMALGMSSTYSTFYSEYLSENVKKGHAQKIATGWWPTFAPIGYENYGDKIHRYIRPQPESAKLVVHAFQLFASGSYSITSLTEELQKKGMLSLENKPISRSAVSRMLRNTIYYGDFKWNGQLYHGEHEPIISRQLFDTVQQLLDLRKVKGTRDRTHNFMLRGHVFCTCGSRLVGEVITRRYKNGKNQLFYYIGCKSRRKLKKCSRVYIRMENLEKMVAEEFKKIEFTEDFKKDVIKTAKSVLSEVRETESNQEKIVKNRIAKIKTRMKNAEDDRMDRVITSDDFTDIYNRMKEELSVAIEDLSKIQSDHTDKIKIPNEILTLSENIYDSYLKADDTLKQKYLRMFFEGIYVDNKEIVQVKYNPVIAQLTRIREVRISDNWRRVRDSNSRPSFLGARFPSVCTRPTMRTLLYVLNYTTFIQLE